VSLAKTTNEEEYGFGLCTSERTHYFQREKGKDFTGTGTALFGIVAGVYLALMGPKGLRAVGETVLERSHYAANMLGAIKGVKVQFKPHFFREFILNFSSSRKKVQAVNKALLKHRIFGGYDLTKNFKDLAGCAQYSVTEVHTKEDIDRLVDAVKEAVKS
jgi:glycine dehydrogenase subunit 1